MKEHKRLDKSSIYLHIKDDSIYKVLNETYSFYAMYNKDMYDWLHTAPHFGAYSEFYELVDHFEQMLWN